MDSSHSALHQPQSQHQSQPQCQLEIANTPTPQQQANPAEAVAWPPGLLANIQATLPMRQSFDAPRHPQAHVPHHQTSATQSIAADVASLSTSADQQQQLMLLAKLLLSPNSTTMLPTSNGQASSQAPPTPTMAPYAPFAHPVTTSQMLHDATCSAAFAAHLQRLLKSKLPTLAASEATLSTPDGWHLKDLPEQHNNMSLQGSGAISHHPEGIVRKEEKHPARRLANRSSARISRARKKPSLMMMAKDNTHLRHEAMILFSLPDPVLAISEEGIITYCNLQIERVLKHEAEDLIGSNIEDIVMPTSRKKFHRMIQNLNRADQRTISCTDETRNAKPSAQDDNETYNNDHDMFSCREEDVDGRNELDTDEIWQDKMAVYGKPILKEKQSSFVLSKSVDGHLAEEHNAPGSGPGEKTGHGSNDSESFEEKASTSLNDNVENCKLNVDRKAEMDRQWLKDDFNGTTVTANNADANLSSLIYRPSLTREKRDSEAPASTVRIICGDLSTIWCELTSSVMPSQKSPGGERKRDFKSSNKSSASHNECKESYKKELLICFRPLFEGDRAGEEHRLASKVSASSAAPNSTSSKSDGGGKQTP
jgi:PAS domain-containing protein